MLKNTNEAVMQSIIRRAEQHIEDMTGVSVSLEIKINCLDSSNPLDKIANLLYREWSILPLHLKKRSRERLIVARKEVFTMIIRTKYPIVPFKSIADYLGGYHHSSAMNWYEEAKGFIDVKDDYFMNLYTPIKNIVDADFN